ncbi:MAG: JAB domain-containing protein [Verrucomicrobiota bacterium]
MQGRPKKTLTSTPTITQNTARAPIALNAYHVILVHNHPSGDPTPSPEDETFTRELRRYMQGLGIRFCDHIILGQSDYYSFSDAGVL